MKAKLINTNVNYLLEDDKGVIIASTSTKEGNNKLSKQNCDEIFGVADVDKWVKEKVDNRFNETDGYHKVVYVEGLVEGFNKALELNKDKVFTESDIFSVVNHILFKLVKVDGFDQKYLFPEEVYQEVTWKTKQIQQPTEIEVMIEMEDVIQLKKRVGGITNMGKPKLDSEGCLILKRIV